MSLTESRRYLLADGVERWRDRQLDAVAAAIGELPPDLTLVLIARAKAPAKLVKAVKAADGRGPRVRGAEGAGDAARPGRRRRRARLPARARRRRACWSSGWAPSPVRLRNELERLALWAGEGGEVTADDLDAMVADTSEAAVWSLSDALLERDAAAALRIAERLIGQGENVTGLIYALASRLRERLRCRRAARGGGAAQAGRVGARACIPTRPSSWSPACGDTDLAEPARRRPRRSPTSRSGAAAAPTTATSWR